jgi:hypothetical protein
MTLGLPQEHDLQYLTEEQHRVIEAAAGKPVEVLDPATNRAYVLVSADTYQQVRDLVEERAATAQAPMSHIPGSAAREPNDDKPDSGII